ncbi:MAG: uroporphyrinogen decarboxylase family protein [Clostridia bacterium]|nr:uroporphyrinogen decarboxylase family protein [Clostridia bacterium]
MTPKDELTPLERMQAFNRRQSVDRIPYIPLMADHAGHFYGVKISEYNLSAEVMANSHIAMYREVPTDAISLAGGWKAQAEAMGCKLVFPEDNTPYVSQHILQDKKKLPQIQPPNPEKDGRLPLHLEAVRRVVEELGHEVEVHIQVGSPLSLAAALRGAEDLMKDFYYDPEFVHTLLRITTQSVLNYSRAIIATGGIPWTSEPVASGSLLSPLHFKNFAFPYLNEVETYLVRETGQAQLHICGNTRKIWGLMADTGATVISLEETVDLAEAKKAVGDRVALMGNVAPLNLLLGTPETVKEEARKSLEKAQDNPAGFILSSGCGIAIGTPTENLRALLELVREQAKV